VHHAIEAHLGSHQVSRVVYGSIVGLALVLAFDVHDSEPGSVAATLAGTAVAIGLAEFYSELIGERTRLRRRHLPDGHVRHLAKDVLAVMFGIASPAVFFVLAAAGVMETDTAYRVARWTGLGLIALYGFCAARLAGAGLARSILQALGVGVIAGALIALKALLH
jgi:hypothetical protein